MGCEDAFLARATDLVLVESCDDAAFGGGTTALALVEVGGCEDTTGHCCTIDLALDLVEVVSCEDVVVHIAKVVGVAHAFPFF